MSLVTTRSGSVRRRLHRLVPHRELDLARLAVALGLPLLVDLAIRHLDGGVGDLEPVWSKKRDILAPSPAARVANGWMWMRPSWWVWMPRTSSPTSVDRRLLLTTDVDGEGGVPVVGRLAGRQLGPRRCVVRPRGLVGGASHRRRCRGRSRRWRRSRLGRARRAACSVACRCRRCGMRPRATLRAELEAIVQQQ